MPLLFLFGFGVGSVLSCMCGPSVATQRHVVLDIERVLKEARRRIEEEAKRKT